MSKIEIDIDKLKEQFVELIDNGINDLDKVIDSLNKLDRPTGFSYNSYLKKIPNELESYKKDCDTIKQYIIDSCINYTNTIEELDNIFKEKSTID